MTAPLLMAATPASDTSAILIGILPWLLIFVIFYMLMIRPPTCRLFALKNWPAASSSGFDQWARNDSRALSPN